MAEKDSVIAEIYDLHGNLLQTVSAPETGIAVGKPVNSVTIIGGRKIHLGVVGEVKEKESVEFDLPEETYVIFWMIIHPFFVCADTSSDL